MNEDVLIRLPMANLHDWIIPHSANLRGSHAEMLSRFLHAHPKWREAKDTPLDPLIVQANREAYLRSQNYRSWDRGPRDVSKEFRFGRFVRPLSLLCRILLEGYRDWEKDYSSAYKGFQKDPTLGIVKVYVSILLKFQMGADCSGFYSPETKRSVHTIYCGHCSIPWPLQVYAYGPVYLREVYDSTPEVAR